MSDILEYIFNKGILKSSEIIAIKKTCRELNENPIKLLRSLKIFDANYLSNLLQEFCQIKALTDKAISALDESYKSIVPIDIAINLCVFAVAEDDNNLYIAMEDPSDKGLIHKLEFFLNKKIIPVIATYTQISTALERLYSIDLTDTKINTTLDNIKKYQQHKNIPFIKPNLKPIPKEHISKEHISKATFIENEDNILDNDDLIAEQLISKISQSNNFNFDNLTTLSDCDNNTLNSGDALFFDEPAKPQYDLNPGETLFFDEPITTPQYDLNPGETLFFDEPAKPQYDLNPGEALFFDEPAKPKYELNPGETLFFDEPAKPQYDLNPGEALFFDEPAKLKYDLNPGETLFFDEPAKPQYELNPGETLFFDEPAKPQYELNPSETLFFDEPITQNLQNEEMFMIDAKHLDNNSIDSSYVFSDLNINDLNNISNDKNFYKNEELIKELSVAVNASLIKLSIINDQNKALTILNNKLSLLNAKIMIPSESKFIFTCKDSTFEGNLLNLPSISDPLFEAIAPALRRLSRCSNLNKNI